MKKKILSGALVLAILAGIAPLSRASSQSQAVVSLSYLAGNFWTDLKSIVFSEVQKDTAYMYNDAIDRAGGEIGTGASSFFTQNGTSGDVVTAATGCSLIWTAGSGIVCSGALVDATEGREVAVGSTLAVGHRYLAGTDIVLAVLSSAAQWMAEGEWTVTAGEPVQPVALPFTDVPQNQWYYDDVSYVYQNGLFNGDSPTRFAPDSKMQRCMMTTVLHRLAGEPTVGYIALFRDIPAGEWYTAGTIWAGQLGVVSGVGNNLFDPFSNVTRQEIAVILYRYAARMGYDMSQSASLSRFSDAASVASWGEQAISWAVGAAILNGSDGALLPNGDATRAEVAAMLHRFDNWMQGQ